MWKKLSKDKKKNSRETGSCFLSAVNVTFIYIFIYIKELDHLMIEPDLSQLIKVLQLRQSNAKNLNKTWIFFPFLEKNTYFPLPISSPNYDNDG